MSSSRPASTSRPSWLRLFLIVVAVAVLAAAAAGAWYLFMRPAAPAEVALAAVPTAAPTDDTTEAPASEEPAAAESAAPAASAAVATGLDGTWTVDPSIGSFDDFSGSFVGYRVTEELVGIGTSTAVGRTPDVTGSLTLAGSTISEATFEADLTTLQSDSGMRDGQLGRQGLETDSLPHGDIRPRGTHRARRRACRGRGDRGDCHRRPDAARRHPAGRDPARGAAVRRGRDRRRIAAGRFR